MKSKLQSLFLIVSIGLAFSGCMHLPIEEQRPPSNQTLTWEARKKQLQAFQSWTVSGAVAAKNPNQQGGQLRFSWQQQADRYAIDLTVPLGGLLAQIEGKPGAVTLQKINSQPVQASTPEAVMARELGWSFPVSYLKDWIRGLPAESSPSTMTFDAYNHLQTLKQHGWDIEFERYTHVRGVDVPGKIILKHPNLLIRLVMTSWA